MASIKKKSEAKNTLQQVIADERAKTPSKYEFNKVLLSWEANDRPIYSFNGAQKSVFTSAVILFGIYFFWIGQPILTLVIAAVFFTLFVFISVPPQRVTHQVEKAGIRTGEVLYVWEDLRSFWMTEKDNTIVLYADTRLNFPARLIFFIESYAEAQIIAGLLIQAIEYRYLPDKQTSFEKMLEGTYIDPAVFFGKGVESVNPLDELKNKK